MKFIDRKALAHDTDLLSVMREAEICKLLSPHPKIMRWVDQSASSSSSGNEGGGRDSGTPIVIVYERFENPRTILEEISESQSYRYSDVK
jgi:hypothetical protein